MDSASISSNQNVISLAQSNQAKYSTLLSSAQTVGVGGSNNSTDRLNVSMEGVYKSLTILSQKVIAKLDEIFKAQGKPTVASLNPEDHTPEKTADNIVTGVAGLFGAYQKQNPNLKGEELVSGFMKTVKQGIDRGYKDAADTLEGIGAFEISGIKSGVEETMALVAKKLDSLEKSLKEQLGVNEDVPKADAVDSEQSDKLPASAT